MAEKHETIVVEAQSQASLEVKKIEENLKEKRSPEQATELAKYLIRNLCKTATEKITGDWELRKDRKEYLKYLDRIENVKKDAVKKIEANKDRYDAIYAFVTRRAELLIMLEKNEQAFSEKVSGTYQVSLLPALDGVAEALQNDLASLKAMKAPDMEKEKQDLVKKIEAQAKKLEEELKKIRDFHMEQLKEFDGTTEYMEDYKQEWESEQKPLKPMVFNAATARKAWQHIFYLKRLQIELAGTGEDDLLAAVDTRIAKLEPLVNYCEKNSFDDSMEQRRKEWAKYKRLEKNLQNARTKVEELERQKFPPRDELQQARSWLAGAEQSAQKQLLSLTRFVTTAQMQEEDDMETPVYAVRTGITTVKSYGEEPAEEQPEQPEKPAAPQRIAAKPEKKKRKAS